MRARGVAFLGAGALAATTAWGRTHPGPFPYWARSVLDGWRPFISRGRLLEALLPVPGERMLELGPGTGQFTLPVAERLGATGRLDILDLQQEMLDHTTRRAARRGIENLVATLGGGSALPYGDGTFDAAFLVTVLGEIPDKASALCELHRVLKANGRLVVGEAVPDPDMIPFRSLTRRARAAGFTFECRIGSSLGFFARFGPIA